MHTHTSIGTQCCSSIYFYNYISMKKYSLIHISDSDKHFWSATTEYIKRLWSHLEIVSLKPTKHWSRSQIIASETKKLLDSLARRYTSQKVYILNSKWTQYTSRSFASTLDTHRSWTIFLVWWAFGLEYETISTHVPTARSISFWEHTMPHGLAKLVLLEQLYRAHMINCWRTYHY